MKSQKGHSEKRKNGSGLRTSKGYVTKKHFDNFWQDIRKASSPINFENKDQVWLSITNQFVIYLSKSYFECVINSLRKFYFINHFSYLMEVLLFTTLLYIKALETKSESAFFTFAKCQLVPRNPKTVDTLQIYISQ